LALLYLSAYCYLFKRACFGAAITNVLMRLANGEQLIVLRNKSLVKVHFFYDCLYQSDLEI
jgi:hypothetical protein